MRFVIDSMLYDTEAAKLIHETGFADKAMGYFRQSLWETPNGNFFYVCESNSPPTAGHFSNPHDLYRIVAAGYGKERKETDQIDAVIVWLESHGGGEVILNRWPERLVIA